MYMIKLIMRLEYLRSVLAGTCYESYNESLGSLYSSTDQYLSGLVPSKGVDSGRLKDVNENRSVRDLPLKFDWSTKNVIGPILDQQRVSAWATVFNNYKTLISRRVEYKYLGNSSQDAPSNYPVRKVGIVLVMYNM